MNRFDAEIALRSIESERINYTLLLPTMVHALVHHPQARDHDLTSLKVVMIGSAPISDSTILLAREIFGDVLCQAYGGTELPLAVFMNSKEWFATLPGSNPLRAAGRPFPWADVRILREDGSLAEPGEPGSVALHSDAQMSGYWQDPEATAETIVGGYVLSGDVGTLDENGFLYILDRKDDMIASGGFHVWPAELENVIAGHPAVSEVAVFAVPDDYWGEAPLAICVLRDGHTATEQELIDLCREQLGSYKKPKRVVFRREPLPKTAVGKVSRKELREPYWAGRVRKVGGA
jgi:acyl-CoA synthetase (AMP-forming)/AMP-acid ligase II